MSRSALAVPAFLLLCAAGSPAVAAPVEWTRSPISDNTEWSGEIVLRRSVEVAKGATLRILPGTSVTVETGKGIAIDVQGRLLLEGEDRAPVAFRPEKPVWAKVLWGGIRLSGGQEAGHSLAGFRIEGAKDGIGITDTCVRVARGTFAACETGIRGNRKSRAAVDDCVFEGNDGGAVFSLGGEGGFRGCRFENIEAYGIVADKGSTIAVSGCTFSRGKTGILLLTNSPCRMEDSAFRSLEKGIVARQSGSGTTVSRCSFENDGAGIQAVQFCFIEVADSSFRGNQTAADVRESSSPNLHHNLFERNQAAVSLFRKSHPKVERNVFRNNRNGIVLNYSSYPLIRGNDFDRNEMSVRLERYMSGEWEEQAGSGERTADEMARRNSRNPEAGEATGGVAFPRRVDARGNYWGADAGRDPDKGMLEKIWDGRKFGPFPVKGTDGRERIVNIDVVDWSEESLAPVPGAGQRSANPEPGVAK